MLLTLFLQVGTGLFANDNILTQGPLYGWVGNQTSNWLTRIHKFNQQVIVALVIVHVSAILFYLFFKGDNLLRPMITGTKQWAGNFAEPVGDRIWVAVVVAALASIAVYLLVRSASF
jgi:cytochrome b